MKTIYRHAEILHDAGIAASVVHGRRGFRADWFDNRCPVVAAEDVTLGPNDVLLVPEIFVDAFGTRPPRRGWRQRLNPRASKEEMPWDTLHPLIESASRLAILSLNPYNTFHRSTLDELHPANPYADPRLIGVLTISEDAESYLQHAFPRVPVVRYTKAVDTSRFSPGSSKGLELCLMPRKHHKDAVQIINLLRVRGALEGVELTVIDGLQEPEVAEIMQRSLVFLSLSHAEGLPRPPMEAMLCECLVVGYHGQGGKEYIKPPHALPFEEGDVVGVARALENVLDSLRRDAAAFDEQRRLGREFILSRYRPEIEEAEVLAFWRNALKQRLGQPI
jgi:hypothetical protein